MRFLTPAERRHAAVCELIREQRMERGLDPGSREDLMPLSIGQLLKIQAELRELPIVRPERRETLFDIEQRGPDRAA